MLADSRPSAASLLCCTRSASRLVSSRKIRVGPGLHAERREMRLNQARAVRRHERRRRIVFRSPCRQVVNE